MQSSRFLFGVPIPKPTFSGSTCCPAKSFGNSLWNAALRAFPLWIPKLAPFGKKARLVKTHPSGFPSVISGMRTSAVRFGISNLVETYSKPLKWKLIFENNVQREKCKF